MSIKTSPSTERIHKVLAEIESAKIEYKEWLKNESIALDERWDLFITTDMGDESGRTDFGLDREDEFLFNDPLYMERYQVRDVGDILEGLKYALKFNLTAEEEIIFKNYCLDNFYIRMKFDW
jgi:hypothetical protein